MMSVLLGRFELDLDFVAASFCDDITNFHAFRCCPSTSLIADSDRPVISPAIAPEQLIHISISIFYENNH
jgi:hypothetical protein